MGKGLSARFVIEGTVVAFVSVLLAAVWLGALYQPASFVSGCVLGTGPLSVAVLGYAVVARRFWVLPALWVFALAVLFPPLVILPAFAAGVVGIPVALVRALLRRTRRSGLLGASSAFLAVLAFGAIHLEVGLRSSGVRRAAHRAEPIIDAMERYQAREGRSPAILDDLVPLDLEVVPGTGMAGYPAFRYYGPEGEFPYGRRLFETYELRVDVGRVLQFDCFAYWPEGSYPEQMYGGLVERMGDWAYVDE